MIAAYFGFWGLFAYGFWSAGPNPTATKYLSIATVSGLVGIALLIAGSKSKPEE